MQLPVRGPLLDFQISRNLLIVGSFPNKLVVLSCVRDFPNSHRVPGDVRIFRKVRISKILSFGGFS